MDWKLGGAAPLLGASRVYFAYRGHPGHAMQCSMDPLNSALVVPDGFNMVEIGKISSKYI